MKKFFMRSVSLLLAFITIFVLSACGSKGNESATDTSETSNNTSEASKAIATPEPLQYADLIWYVVGDAHADQAMVDAELNKKLEKDVNATVKLNFTTWNDWQSKYNLLLVSGETVDMIFASSWADFTKYAKMGAYQDITEMLPKYAPQTWANVPKDDWKAATFDGKIFGVPCTNPEFTPAGLFYREDLRKKFNLPEIKDVASIEAYLDGIKKNSTEMIPIENGINEIKALYYWSNKYEPIAGAEDDLVQVKSYDTPRDIIVYPFTDEYVEFCKMTREWQQKGYWSKDILSTKTTAGDALKAGKAAVAQMNPGSAYGYFSNFEKEHPTWEGGYFPFSRLKGYTIANSPMNNGMAIPKSAKNPERSLMVLDLLRNDAGYNQLTTYGIPGYHWDLADDGKTRVVPAKGQDPVKNKGFWTTSWGWANYKLAMEDVNVWKGKSTLISEFMGVERENYLSDVKLDKTEVKAVEAAIKQVKEKYASILFMGMEADVDKAIAEYRDQLKKAGIDKYTEEIKKQLFQYYDERGIK